MGKKNVISVGRPDKLGFWEKLYLPELLRGMANRLRGIADIDRV